VIRSRGRGAGIAAGALFQVMALIVVSSGLEPVFRT
jgi:hypothetical protein